MNFNIFFHPLALALFLEEKYGVEVVSMDLDFSWGFGTVRFADGSWDKVYRHDFIWRPRILEPFRP